MKNLAVIVVACGLFAQVAAAQQFQGLGAADPSQQLKTAGMMNTFQNQTNTLRREERKEPLVQGTADPGDPQERPAQPQPAPAQAAQAAQATAAQAQAPAYLAPSPSPWPSPSPAVEPPAQRPTPVVDSNASAPQKWNPASNPTPAATDAAPVSQSARMSRIQELVDQIKHRRESR